ncbi:MAG: hypothetical protein QOE45_1728 [Frankiaceae bacterium]|jgi:hypothetical protein|nr:hypothetical protein [Frankiaceae bacterium]
MDRTRALRLRRETLTELSTGELELIVAAGGGPEPTPPVYVVTHECPTKTCVVITGGCC